MQKYMKLSQYAKNLGIHYKTAWRHWHENKLNGYQDPETGTIYVLDKDTNTPSGSQTRAILYARVSSTTNKASLDGQLDRMRQFAAAKGYTIVEERKEIASGLNENRKQLLPLLSRQDYDILIVEHKDRLSRFGFTYIEQALTNNGVKLEIINQMDNKDNELIDDFVSIITSFCSRIYGRKRKAKTQEIINQLELAPKEKSDETGL
jgi:putative resolvase